MATDTRAEEAAVARIRAENVAANATVRSAESGSSIGGTESSTHYGTGTPVVTTNPYAPSYGGGSQVLTPFDKTTIIPSVGGYTSFMTPAGERFDAPTSQYASILAAGGKVAPFVPSRERSNVVWATPEQYELKKKILENPQTVYASAKVYEELYKGTSSFGNIKPQEYVFVAPSETDLPRAAGAPTPFGEQFPSTPIEAETPKGYGYTTYPIYQAAERMGQRAEESFLSNPNVDPNDKFGTAIRETVTGLPAYVASGAVGVEAYFREQEKYKEQAKAERKTTFTYMFDKGIEAMGRDLLKTAKAEPETVAGSLVGMAILGKGISEIPKTQLPRLKLIETSEPSAIPGAAILIKKKIRLKLEQIEKPKELEVVPEVVDLSKAEPMKTSKYQKAIPLIKSKKNVLEQQKTDATLTRSGDLYKGETQFDVSQSKPSVKLMSEVERAKVIEKIKQSGGLYQKQIQTPRQKFSQFATTIVRASELQNQETKQNAIGLNLQKPVSIQDTIQEVIQYPRYKVNISQKQKYKQDPYVVGSLKYETPQGVEPTSVTLQTPELKTPQKQQPKLDEPFRTPVYPRITETPRNPPKEPPTKKPPKPSKDEPSDALEFKFNKPQKEKKKASRKSDPWFPASLENVTIEEFALRGKKRAVHIASRKLSQAYERRLVTTGQSIPTLAQSQSNTKSIWRNIKI